MKSKEEPEELLLSLDLEHVRIGKERGYLKQGLLYKDVDIMKQIERAYEDAVLEIGLYYGS